MINKNKKIYITKIFKYFLNLNAQNGIFNIYTENTKDFKIKWINAVNPLL